MNLVGKNRVEGLPVWTWRRASEAVRFADFGFWGFFYFGSPAGGG